MTTVLDIIKDAMSEAGITTQNETPTNSETQDALRVLNRMIDSWSNSGTMIYTTPTESFSLTSGTASYTIGDGGTFDTVKPNKIVQAHVRIANIDYNLNIEPDSVYQGITYKTIGNIPEILNFTNAYPLATINLYPVPSQAMTLFITSEKPLTTYASTNTALVVPPGTEDALVYNLALRLSSKYGKKASEELKQMASSSKAAIALNTVRNNPLRSQALQSRTDNNIFSGYAT